MTTNFITTNRTVDQRIPIDDISLIFGKGSIHHNHKVRSGVTFCFGEDDRQHVSIEPTLDQFYLKGDLILVCDDGRRFALEYFGAAGIFRYRALSGR
jgi:hypothetical protein